MHSRSSTFEDCDDLVLVTMHHIHVAHFHGTWVRIVFQRYVCLTDALCAIFDWLPSMSHHVLSEVMRDHTSLCQDMLLFQVGQHGTPFVAGDASLLKVVFETLSGYGFHAPGYDEFAGFLEPVRVACFFCGATILILCVAFV